MKRLVLAIAAAATLAGPILTAGAVQAQSRGGYDRYDRNDRNDRYDRHDRYDHRGPDRGPGRYDGRGYDNHRWDGARNNGYYLGNRWYYGPPSTSYYGRSDYRPSYRAWQRGGYLPRNYWGYGVNDYGRYRLRQPPRGYHWVRVNNDFVLTAIATGLIADVIINGGY